VNSRREFDTNAHVNHFFGSRERPAKLNEFNEIAAARAGDR
jgi:hypothetical protein